jgi:hypothetical protein
LFWSGSRAGGLCHQEEKVGELDNLAVRTARQIRSGLIAGVLILPDQLDARRQSELKFSVLLGRGCRIGCGTP